MNSLGVNLECDEKFQKYLYVHTELEESHFSDVQEPPVVMTVGHQRDLQMLASWIQHGDPFIVVGDEGCGKNLLIQSAFKILK